MERTSVRVQWAKSLEELLSIEDVREAEIVAVGGYARMTVLGDNNVTAITGEEVQECVSVTKTGTGLD